MRCECECHRTECASSFLITIESYERVRAHARCFVVAPGHQRLGESVLSTAMSYWVIGAM